MAQKSKLWRRFPVKQNKNPRLSLVYLAQAGVIAAAYTALTVLLQPLSYGALQVRVSEMLTILPVYTPAAIPGLAVGCFLSNLLGLSSGANPAGGWDLLFGTLATLVAAWLTRKGKAVRPGGVPLLSTLPPVFVNAVVIGAELYVVYGGFPWWLHMLAVAGGQLVACVGCGLLFATTLEKTGIVKHLLS
ncbi:MAG: QueT transporter family protein [Clostridia bacterium]|nr:QueT transporter family protein [Clostridia bacterium]